MTTLFACLNRWDLLFFMVFVNHVFGLIYDVQVPDDPSVRQLILTGEMEPEVMRDQRENRLVPIEVSVLVVGYQHQKRIFQGLNTRSLYQRR